MFLLLSLLLLGSVSLFSEPASAQVVCAQLGHYLSCNNGSIQADLGNNRGVIVGPRETTPYVILPSPVQTPHRTSPAAPIFVPTIESRRDRNEGTVVYEAPASGGVYGYQAPLPYPPGVGE